MVQLFSSLRLKILENRDFSKRIKQPRDNNFKYNNKQKAKSNFVVHENDFPPL